MLLRYHENITTVCDGCKTIQTIYGTETSNGNRFCKSCFEDLLEEAEVLDEENSM